MNRTSVIQRTALTALALSPLSYLAAEQVPGQVHANIIGPVVLTYQTPLHFGDIVIKPKSKGGFMKVPLSGDRLPTGDIMPGKTKGSAGVFHLDSISDTSCSIKVAKKFDIFRVVNGKAKSLKGSVSVTIDDIAIDGKAINWDLKDGKKTEMFLTKAGSHHTVEVGGTLEVRPDTKVGKYEGNCLLEVVYES